MLAKPAILPNAAVDQLGASLSDLGPPGPITFRPGDSAFTEGQLFRQGSSERISHVSLVSRDAVAIADLEEVFGRSRYDQSMQLQAPSERIYQVAEPQSTWACTVFASVVDPEARTTYAISVRRDPRAPRS